MTLSSPAAPALSDIEMQDSETTAGVRVGDILAGKYRVDGVLGEGGMGVVVAAHHLQLDEPVALKFLLPAALKNADTMARFAREARAAVKIKSEHVARVIDVGTLETGAPYIVMEFLRGSDLSVWLAEKGPLPIEQAVEFVLQGCEAIAEAHSLGIIHRDLKPANLFVVRRNDGLHSVKVLDFGISKMTQNGPDMAGTKTSLVMGSPFYMSPEQMRSSKDVTPQSDIWALGVILHELLAGQTPFSGETFPEICIKIGTEPPASLRSVRPDAPAALEAVVRKCLEKDRHLRYRDVAQLALALQEFAPKRAKASVDRILGILQSPGLSATEMVHAAASGAVVLAAAAGPVASSPPGTIGSFGQTTRGMSRRTKGATAGIGLVCALLAAAGFVAARRSAKSSVSTAGVAAAPAQGTTTPAALAPALPASPPVDPVAPPVAAPVAPPSSPAEPSANAAAAVHGSAPVHATPSPPPNHAKPVAIAAPAPSPLTSAPAAAPAPATARAPAPNCDPPFYFDANGIRVFKKECVR